MSEQVPTPDGVLVRDEHQQGAGDAHPERGAQVDCYEAGSGKPRAEADVRRKRAAAIKGGTIWEGGL